MQSMPDERSATKVFYSGTHRVRHPEETWSSIFEDMERYGITRVADLTGLDDLGVPVVQAVRPLAKTLSVSQGKGQDLLLAKISAVMETIETWHAENVRHHPGVERCSLRESGVPTPPGLRMLEGSKGTFDSDRKHDWIRGYTLTHGHEHAVPISSIELSFEISNPFMDPHFRSSSTGLASGNTVSEAILHGFFEVIERAARARISEHTASSTYVNFSTVTDPYCVDVWQRMAEMAHVQVRAVPNAWAVPVYEVGIEREDLPGISARGSGAHLDPGVALSRALTEAAQTRLTLIAGTRDDIDVETYLRPQHSRRPAVEGEADWTEFWDIDPLNNGIEDDLKHLEEKIDKVSGAQVVIVDLAETDYYAVVKVLCPKLFESSFA